MNEISKRIKDRRESLGLNQTEVAEYLGVNKSTVLRWENGDIKTVGLDKIEKLSEILKTTPGWIMGWETETINFKDVEGLNELVSEGYIEVCKSAKEKGLSPQNVQEIINLIKKFSN